MKTTVEISDSLAQAARELAAREKTTLRALIEQGLRQVVDQHARAPAFRLRDASFRGEGLQPEFRDATWEQMRDLVYPVPDSSQDLVSEPTRSWPVDRKPDSESEDR